MATSAEAQALSRAFSQVGLNTDARPLRVGEMRLRVHGDHPPDLDLDQVLAPFDYVEVSRKSIADEVQA